MRANLEQGGGMLMAEALTMALAPRLGRPAAQRVVQAACERALAAGQTLRQAALVDEAVRAVLDPAAIERALDPAGYLGSANALIDRALAAYRALLAEEEA
jgi:3-carboxy-cis,cis-muconate cycloisomerase